MTAHDRTAHDRWVPEAAARRGRGRRERRAEFVGTDAVPLLPPPLSLLMLLDAVSPQAIAARIRSLIAQHDGGDITAAARRLGLPIATLVRLEEQLAEDGSTIVPDVLAAVVVRYRADACWLLTGSELPRMTDLPVAVRLRLSDLLLAIGDRLLADYRAHRQVASSDPRASASV